MDNAYPSKLLEKAVGEFSKLPGIGRKTALRLVLNMLRRSEEEVEEFAGAVSRLRKDVKYCRVCHNISDTDVCPICSDTRRDASTICVVENIRDVMAVENTQQYSGLYHVLGGIISPMDGITADKLHIKELIARVEEDQVQEIIIATNPSVEGESTAVLLEKLLHEKYPELKITRLARGLPLGISLEYADQITLSSALTNRTKL